MQGYLLSVISNRTEIAVLSRALVCISSSMFLESFSTHYDWCCVITFLSSALPPLCVVRFAPELYSYNRMVVKYNWKQSDRHDWRSSLSGAKRMKVTRVCYCFQHKHEGAPAAGAGEALGDAYPGSFEKCSLLTAVLTNLGLYILMFLGFVNQLLFTPRVATEANREVTLPLKHCELALSWLKFFSSA